MNLQLQGKSVVVTGASGGIGGAIARAFSSEGCRLVLHCNQGRSRVEKLAGELGNGHMILQADLTQESQVEDFFSQAERGVGVLHVLVAAAGLWPGEHEDVLNMDLARWRKTIDADLTSIFLCCRSYLKVVARQRLGNVVLIGSHAGVFGEAGAADYAAAKAAVCFALTKSLKVEIARLAPHGRINTVAPGWTLTHPTPPSPQSFEALRSTLQLTATRRLNDPADIAPITVFLASDAAARQITGQVILVNGGQDSQMFWTIEEAIAL